MRRFFTRPPGGWHGSMRLLVTGGGGLMGSKVAELALERGYEVFSGYAHNKPEHGVCVRLNLENKADIINAVKASRAEVIIHTAAITDVDYCEKNKQLAYKVNALGTRVLAKAARDIGAFTIYASTDYVFDGFRGMYREEDATNPINYYGYSKLLGEGCCDAVARACVIYGARPASGKINFALWLIEQLSRGKNVRIVTDQFITPTLNTNLAEVVLELAETRLSGVYHLSGATRISRFEFACMLADEFELNRDLIFPSRMSEMSWVARRPADSSLDTSKARRCLSSKPLEFREALRTLREELF
jgi:dTDP-4-dehydrorhamnose reductase